MISVLRTGVVACDCTHLYLVFTYLQFSRIDSVFSTGEIGVSACNPDSHRDCPSATVTCPSLLMWANTTTSILKVHHLTDHRKETSKFLLSPLLTSTKLYMVAA